MLTARRTARKASLESSGQPPEWFTQFKQGMEARVSDLENQLEEKTDEVQALRERVEALEAGSSAPPRRVENSHDELQDKPAETKAVPSSVPKLSLGQPAGGESKAPTSPGDNKGPVADVKKKSSGLASPKTRPATGTKMSPKGDSQAAK